MPILQGVVGLSNTSNADGSNPIVLLGKSAEAIVAELHGKWYTAAYRGRVFHGSTNITGTTITTQTTTTSCFMLYNPAGSGVNVEMIGTDIGMIGSTTVVATIMQKVGATAAATPTSTITVLVASDLFNGAAGTNQAKLFTLSTITAMTFFYPLFNLTTTTSIAVGNLHYDWDGKLILPPAGIGADLGSNITQSAAFVCAYDWAEWPV